VEKAKEKAREQAREEEKAGKEKVKMEEGEDEE
jgi:hypothetical protein